MPHWKEYITIDSIELILVALTFIAAVAALVIAKRSFKVSKSSLDVAERSLKYAQDSDQQRIMSDIANKEAQLKTMDRIMTIMGPDAILQQAILKAEIEQLKQQL